MQGDTGSERRVLRRPEQEKVGWLQMIGIIMLFPLLFFICVFLPMWLGWAERFP